MKWLVMLNYLILSGNFALANNTDIDYYNADGTVTVCNSNYCKMDSSKTLGTICLDKSGNYTWCNTTNNDNNIGTATTIFIPRCHLEIIKDDEKYSQTGYILNIRNCPEIHIDRKEKDKTIIEFN